MERSKNATGAGLEISQAAAAMGRIKTEKKTAASRRNIEKARNAVSLESLRNNAAKATAASAAKSRLLSPEERSERARRAVMARWNKARKAQDSEQ